jgi:diguanylate cyclase (GGDEF)-like protein
MISLKRYLEANAHQTAKPEEDCSDRFAVLLAAYRSSLIAMGECGATACPGLGTELKNGVARIEETMGEQPDAIAILTARNGLSELLEHWETKTTRHHLERAGEVKDLLLVMARTAESLGHKDDRYLRQLESLTAQLQTIASLEDVARIRSSVEESARQLKNSIARMTAEGKAVIDHLRVEVSTYQAKLEKAEYIASCDPLTGLRSRLWIEQRIQQKIDAASRFSILMIDINDFRHVNHEYGNLVGDLLLKEFARELRSSCRFSDLVARWGGDKFLVVLDSPKSQASLQAERLRSWICRPYNVPGRSGHVSVHMDASIGITEYREGDSLLDLLERADVAGWAQQGPAQDEKTA